MNAALYRHAKTHNNAVVFFNANYKQYDWLVDLDFHAVTDEGAVLIRPDLAAVKDGAIKIAVEISDSTISKDLDTKKSIYRRASVEHYIVFDCNKKQVYQWRLEGTIYQESDYFSNLDSIFNEG